MAIDPLPPPPHRFAVDGQTHSLVVDLPMLESLAGVELDIGQQEIRLCLPDGGATCISLPEVITNSSHDDSAVAKFSKKRRQLTISWSLSDTVKDLAATTCDSKTEDEREPVQTATICDSKAKDESEPVQTATIHDSKAEDGREPVQTVTTCDSKADDEREPVQTPRKDEPSNSEVPRPAGAQGLAYGSLWNANSWHWEEKNCMDILRSEVQRTLEQCAAERLTHINDLSGASVVFKDISVEGEASFTLRRGKRILCYEFTLSFNWSVNDAYGSYLGAKGRGHAEELTQDEDRPTVSMEVSTSTSGGADAKAAGSWMTRKGSKEISQYLIGSRLTPSILSVEEARVNAAQDVARRAQEKERAANAEKATGDERARLAAEQRRLEEAHRLKPTEGSVQGSVWNANAWHWEEKSMTSWARVWLKGKLDGFTMNLFGGMATASLSDTEISGDASVSVRKGRPISLFQLRIECAWTVIASTPGVEESEGKLLIPDFTSEDGAKSAIEFQPASGKKKTSQQLLTCLRRDGVPLVRTILAQFIEELGGQLERTA